MSTEEINDKEMDQDFNNQETDSQDTDNQEEMSVEKLHEEEVLKLGEEVKKERDNFLRLFAEFENYKKRTSRERIELFSTANKEVMTVLLPILDDFERGIQEIKKSDDDALLQGMELIFNKLKNTLNQKGLKVMEVKQGDSFDAEIHEAITQIPAPSKKLKGKIVDVIEKGYKLGDTIIRFPKVVLGN
jgi:molecular chaperone GrpE